MSAATPLPAESSSRRKSNELLLAGGLLFAARADQDADHTVIAFVARGIEDHVLIIRGAAHIDLDGPRPGPRLRIIKGNLAPKGIRIQARDVLDHLRSE